VLLYREPRTLERIHMAFRPSKRPSSSSATRREQRKASGNAALAAGRIISALMEDAVT